MSLLPIDVMIPKPTGQRDSSRRPAARLALLERFYTRYGLEFPAVTAIRNEQMPEPFKRLLIHCHDMTSTLEGYYGNAMRITVLSREVGHGGYLREVVLQPEGGTKPVEYGVIHIHLDQLPANARRRVLEEERPLGNILHTEAVPYLSWPQSFFWIGPDSHMKRVLCLQQPRVLYGRRNLLLDGNRHLLAEVIEVLAPVPGPHAAEATSTVETGSHATQVETT
jgi:chorismate-pyruvate lyase